MPSPPATASAVNRRKRIKHRYGVTEEQYDAQLAKQGGRCAVCDQDCPTHRNLSVDHDHETGEFRGLLCMRCNAGLGLFKDDHMLLLKAYDYLTGTD